MPVGAGPGIAFSGASNKPLWGDSRVAIRESCGATRVAQDAALPVAVDALYEPAFAGDAGVRDGRKSGGAIGCEGVRGHVRGGERTGLQDFKASGGETFGW